MPLSLTTKSVECNGRFCVVSPFLLIIPTITAEEGLPAFQTHESQQLQSSHSSQST